MRCFVRTLAGKCGFVCHAPKLSHEGLFNLTLRQQRLCSADWLVGAREDHFARVSSTSSSEPIRFNGVAANLYATPVCFDSVELWVDG